MECRPRSVYTTGRRIADLQNGEELQYFDSQSETLYLQYWSLNAKDTLVPTHWSFVPFVLSHRNDIGDRDESVHWLQY